MLTDTINNYWITYIWDKSNTMVGEVCGIEYDTRYRDTRDIDIRRFM